MENFELTYNERFNGATAICCVESGTVTTSFRNSGTVYSVGKGYALTCTGYLWFFDNGNKAWVQTTSGFYFLLESGYDWQMTDAAAKVVSKTTRDAQKQINKIISNNQSILENNLVCARFADKLTADQKGLLRELQERMEARNSALLEDGFCSVETIVAPDGYSELQSWLSGFMSGKSVGSVTVAIVVAAVVVASLSTAAYFAYKYLADESESDLRYSKELTKALTAKLTEEEYAQLLEETKGIVTRAKLKSKLSAFGSKSMLLLGGAIALGLILKYKQ